MTLPSKGGVPRRLSLLLALMILVWPHVGAAQTIVGRILEVESSEPVAGAEVVLLDENAIPVVRHFSDTAGGFLIPTSGTGRFRLSVSHIGLAAYTSEEFRVSGGEVITVEVRMGIEAVPLDPITVTARRSHQAAHLEEFERRRTHPGGLNGYFLTQEDIEHRSFVTATQLTRQLPGVSLRQLRTAANAVGLDRSLIMLRGPFGQCAANVFVDGIRIRQSQDHSPDDLLDPSLIAGVEVYPRALLAPIQYQVDDDCGVVLYWTRRPEGGNDWGLKRILAGVAVLGGLIIGAFSIGG